MIINEHPTLKLLESCPYECHLIGSRYIGESTHTSDYDFILITKKENWLETREWLQTNEFKTGQPDNYGPDDRLIGTNVWTWKSDSLEFPSVDIFPMTKEEAQMRLTWFKLMKELPEYRAIKMIQGLSTGRAWAHLWEVLSILN